LKLTERNIPFAKPGRHSVGDGLYLSVSPDRQVRRWIHRYSRPNGAGVTEAGLGLFPVVRLEEAKATVLEHRRMLRNGVDPIQAKREQQRAGVTFKQAADKYVSALHVSASQLRNVNHWLYVHLRPLHAVPINQIDAERAREVIGPLMHTDKARRTLGVLKRVLDDNGYHLQYKLRHKVVHEHFEALPYQHIPAFIQRLHGPSPIRQWVGANDPSTVAAALEFLILTCAPSKEVVTLRRSDIVDGVWNLTRFKTNQSYRIPLSARALEILDQHDWSGISRQVLHRLLRKLHPSASVHGMRSVFMDWGFEQAGYDATMLDLCLGHKVRGVMRHYLRGDALEKRRVIMQTWADHCCGKDRSVLQAAE
jgi:integrase